MSSTWIVNATAIHPDTGEQETWHVRVADGKIAERRTGETPDLSGSEVIDAQGKLIAPGLIDMHVHLREPGFEHKETIRSGTRVGGERRIYDDRLMPNTRPVTDTPETVRVRAG